MRIKGKFIFTWICLLFTLAPSSCAAPRPLGLPFSVSQVEKIELYRFVIPAQARKKNYFGGRRDSMDLRRPGGSGGGGQYLGAGIRRAGYQFPVLS